MGLVLWIDQNTFASSLLEKVFKRKNLPFYTLETAADFAFLVDDLKPSLLVLDHSTAIASLEKLKAQFGASSSLRNLPVIFIDGSSDLDFIEKRVGELKRPFDPFEIPEVISKMFAAN